MTKLEFIEKYGEEAYIRHVNKIKEWHNKNKEYVKALASKWNKEHKIEYNNRLKNYYRENKQMFAYCIKEEIEYIENYDKAKLENFNGWIIHHRLETHNSDGEKRIVNLTVNELKELGMYFNRPAKELIFLTRSEHSKLHKQNN